LLRVLVLLLVVLFSCVSEACQKEVLSRICLLIASIHKRVKASKTAARAQRCARCCCCCCCCCYGTVVEHCAAFGWCRRCCVAVWCKWSSPKHPTLPESRTAALFASAREKKLLAHDDLFCTRLRLSLSVYT